MADEEAGGGTAETAEAGTEQLWLTWETRVRVLFNPAVWGGMLVAFGSGACLLSILLLVVSKSLWGLIVPAGVFAFLMGIFVVVALFIDLFGGFRTTFALTTHGVRSIAGKGAGRAADAAFWTGVLLGSAGAAGAGLLAKSERNVCIPYGEVTKVKFKPGRRYILVKGGFLQKPIGLYCTPENYDQAEAILRQECSGATIA